MLYARLVVLSDFLQLSIVHNSKTLRVLQLCFNNIQSTELANSLMHKRVTEI
jgi:hypothetical protein